MQQQSIRIIPLGGVSEIGKNCIVFESDRDMIMVECGVMFPEALTLGVDLIIPDFSYVLERADKLRALVLTHGHDDHIGASGYFLSQLGRQLKVVGTPLTVGLAAARIEEQKATRFAEFQPVKAGDTVDFGELKVEFCHVTHSVPDATCLLIDTPAGLIVHSGDFKFDSDPEDGLPSDLDRLAAAGKRGVTALLCEATRVEQRKPTGTEKAVGAAIDHAVANSKGRVIVSTFASNINRIKQAVAAAQNHGRRVAVFGRSMERNLEVAIELGYIELPPEARADLSRLNKTADDELLYMVTGSQGEPTSVLGRLAAGNHPGITVREGDTVILSSSVVPGNEEAVFHMVDSLFRRGANVIYNTIEPGVHVSGHGSRPEIGEMIRLTSPRYLIAIHGEYRHQHHLRELAVEVGVERENVVIPEVGEVIEVGRHSIGLNGEVKAGPVMVDGLTVGQIDARVLRERDQLADDGLLTVTAVLDARDGRVLDGPQILHRGFADEGGDELLEDARRVVAAVLREMDGKRVVRKAVVDGIKEAVTDIVWQRSKRRPLILVVVNLV